MEHTKLPWVEGEDGDIFCADGCCCIATVTKDTDNPREANAAFIVTACNNYERVCAERDKLGAALQSLSSWVKKDLQERHIPWCFKSVDTALKNAGGK